MLQSYEMIGLCGVACGIVAYARVQWKRDFAKSYSYSLLNLFSSVFTIISLLHDWNLASFVSNALWVGLSLYGLFRCAKYSWRSDPRPVLGGEKPIGVPAHEG